MEVKDTLREFFLNYLKEENYECRKCGESNITITNDPFIWSNSYSFTVFLNCENKNCRAVFKIEFAMKLTDNEAYNNRPYDPDFLKKPLTEKTIHKK